MNSQSGMALLVSLVFMLLLSLIGLASMVSATQQVKMAGSVQHANHSFQAAESALRSGEYWLQVEWRTMVGCTSPSGCTPPVTVGAQAGPAIDPESRVRWIRVPDGLFGVQSLGPSTGAAHLPEAAVSHLYRVTGIGIRGQSRTVLESIHARYQGADDSSEAGVPQRFRRIMWRQLQ